MFGLPGMPNFADMGAKLEEFQNLFAEAVGTMKEMRDDIKELRIELQNARVEIAELKEGK